MTRIAYTKDNQDITYSQLAATGILEYLDYLTKHRSMEFVSLVSLNFAKDPVMKLIKRSSYHKKKWRRFYGLTNFLSAG